MTIKVLFVCLGNICRSPMAEGIFQKMVDGAGLTNKIQVDSAGTDSWHAGERAHPGTRRILQQHGIQYNGRSRQVRSGESLDADTYLIAMDSSNLRDLQRMFSGHPRLYRLLDFAAETRLQDVPDPYYENNFEFVYELVYDGCGGLLATIRREMGL